MDTKPITTITRRELRDKIQERSAKKEGDGTALYTMRRGLRSLELFCTPDTIGGDLALEVCHAIDAVEADAKTRNDLVTALADMVSTAKEVEGMMDGDRNKQESWREELGRLYVALDAARAALIAAQQ